MHFNGNELSKMKVAFVLSTQGYMGGVERRIIRIYNELCSEYKNIFCDVIFIGTDMTRIQTMLRQADCPIEGVRIRAFKRRRTAALYLLCSDQYQVIHYFSEGRFYMVVQGICRMKRKKSLYTACSYPRVYNLASETCIKSFKSHLRYADYVDLLYPAGEAFVRQYTRGKIFITPGTFTSLETFRPIKKEKTLLYAAARLEENKNPMLLMKAVCLCQQHIRRNGYRVIVLGKGQYETEMKSYILQNQLSDFVEMAGYERTSKYLPSAEVFFSLQKYENYPSQSLAEAVACGCYSIITDVGDSRKCAKEEFAAFVEGNAQSVAQAIIRYFEMSAAEKRNVVTFARQFALQNYSIEQSKEYYKKLLEDICK